MALHRPVGRRLTAVGVRADKKGLAGTLAGRAFDLALYALILGASGVADPDLAITVRRRPSQDR